EDIRFVKIIQSSGALSDDVSFTGSELYFYEDTLKNTPQNAIDRANWNVTVQDADGKEVDGSPLIDDDLDTIVDFYDGSDEWPYTILVDLGEVDEIASLGYQKRPGFEDENYGLNGTIGEFKVEVSTDGEEWIDAGTSKFTEEDYDLHEVDGLYNVGVPVYASLDQTH